LRHMLPSLIFLSISARTSPSMKAVGTVAKRYRPRAAAVQVQEQRLVFVALDKSLA
jgi:hypothetical protein